MADNRPPPFGVNVIPEFLSKEACQELVAYAEQCDTEWLTVVDEAASTTDQIVRVKHPGRVTELVNLKERQQEINELIISTYQDVVSPYYSTSFDWLEAPQMLSYGPGGKYQAHADSDHFMEEEGLWRKDIDRDISLLLYLNEDYEGGSLYFSRFNYRLQPKTGMLVTFPSDHRYTHAAETLKSGTRFVIVCWASRHGEEKVRAEAPLKSIFLEMEAQE